jgi:hypothetical protein
MKIRVAILVVGSFAFLIRADPILSWTDDEGVTHYTDDSSRIPNKYRAKRLSGPDINEIVGDEESDARPEPSAGVRPLDERGWRQRFHDAYARIQSLERKIDEDKAQVEESGLPVLHQGKQYRAPNGTVVVLDDPKFLEAKHRLKRNRELLRKAKVDLDKLDVEAANHSVPQEWRVP